MKRIIKIALFIIPLLFATKVNAITLNSTKDWGGFQIYKIQDGEVLTTHLRKLDVDGEAAYCIDYGAHIVAGEVNQIDFVTYFSRGISTSAAQVLERNINDYLYFGYGSTGRTTDKYRYATQKIIWELVNDTGFYGSNDYTTRIGATSFRDVQYKVEDGDNIDISQEVAAIKKSVSDYYVMPSMCSSSVKLELAVNASKTFTDTNGVLSQYKVNCSSGLKCEINNNTLTVTATSDGNNKTISFTKSGKGTPAILYENPNKDETEKETQRVITGGAVGPVSCNFGIDTYQNVQTGTGIVTMLGIIGILAIMAATIICFKVINTTGKESA